MDAIIGVLFIFINGLMSINVLLAYAYVKKDISLFIYASVEERPVEKFIG